jgi:serine/threonine-protein kinase
MLRPADQMTMHFVSAGPFLMGSTPDDADSRPHEQPQHQVTLGPFWLDQTEVTNAQYQLCVAAGACEPPVLRTFFDDLTYADHPIVYVTWDHATDYCAWLASETGWPVALPTEAQWEKAAAWDPGAQLHRRYPWGDQPPGVDHANLNTSGLGRTASVGSYPDGVSFYGLLDLAGNVWEWVADWYDPHYYDTPDLPPDPTGPTSGSQRVMRGGSYGFGAVEARTAHRTAAGPQASGVALGFRCAVNAQELP